MFLHTALYRLGAEKQKNRLSGGKKVYRVSEIQMILLKNQKKRNSRFYVNCAFDLLLISHSEFLIPNFT